MLVRVRLLHLFIMPINCLLLLLIFSLKCVLMRLELMLAFLFLHTLLSFVNHVYCNFCTSVNTYVIISLPFSKLKNKIIVKSRASQPQMKLFLLLVLLFYQRRTFVNCEIVFSANVTKSYNGAKSLCEFATATIATVSSSDLTKEQTIIFATYTSGKNIEVLN